MTVSEVRNNRDRVQSRVLGERVGNDFECLREGLDTEGLNSFKRPGVLSELLSKLDLDGSATGDDASVLDEAADDAEGVVEGSLGLVNDLK